MPEPVEELLAFVARSLVAQPEQVRVTRSERDGAVVFELHVAPEDVGKVIGKGGRIARALRTLVRASGTKTGERRLLEIVE
jgi:uncharacterized protein